MAPHKLVPATAVGISLDTHTFPDLSIASQDVVLIPLFVYPVDGLIGVPIVPLVLLNSLMELPLPFAVQIRFAPSTATTVGSSIPPPVNPLLPESTVPLLLYSVNTASALLPTQMFPERSIATSSGSDSPLPVSFASETPCALSFSTASVPLLPLP